MTQHIEHVLFLHGSAVEQGGNAILFLGKPRSGKTVQVIRHIREGWRLVADDYVKLEKTQRAVCISPAERIRGLLEWRDVGIARLPFSEKAILKDIYCLAEEAGSLLPDWIRDCVTIHESHKLIT